MIEARQHTERLLERSGRITPREVLEAYERTGLSVGFGCFFNEVDGSVCPLTAIAAQSTGEVPRSDDHAYKIIVRVLSRRNIPLCSHPDADSYGDGFWHGVDNTSGFGSITQHFRGMRRVGWRDGLRVRRFILSRPVGPV